MVSTLTPGEMMNWAPAEMFGPSYIKALRAPLPHAPLMPTAMAPLANHSPRFSTVTPPVGSSLSGPGAKGDYAAVTTRAREFVAQMAAVRK